MESNEPRTVPVLCWNGPLQGQTFNLFVEDVVFGKMYVLLDKGNQYQYVFDRRVERGVAKDVLLWKDSSPGLAAGYPRR